jgi:hypothetical protein
VLEDGLPADLEKRFNKNEKHVYTQRLYEGRGKRLQKTIATRYENERPMRNQVDAYIKHFERLLDTVAEAPQGNQMVRNCLHVGVRQDLYDAGRKSLSAHFQAEPALCSFRLIRAAHR